MKYEGNISIGKLGKCFNNIFWSASDEDETVESLKEKMNSLKKTYDLDHNEENQYKYLLSTWLWWKHGNWDMGCPTEIIDCESMTGYKSVFQAVKIPEYVQFMLLMNIVLDPWNLSTQEDFDPNDNNRVEDGFPATEDFWATLDIHGEFFGLDLIKSVGKIFNKIISQDDLDSLALTCPADGGLWKDFLLSEAMLNCVKDYLDEYISVLKEINLITNTEEIMCKMA